MPRGRTTDSHRPDIVVSRRSVVAASVGIAALPAASPLDAAAVDAAEDERFMRIAIAEARRADLPFGAVIVRDGRILATGAMWDGARAIRPRMARWSRSAAVSRRMARTR